MSKTVLVTGAGGFIGLNTVKEFSQNGWRVLALVRKNIPDELKSLENLRFDFIINTAPSMIFSEDIIKNIKFETSFIEVASKNGIDKNACKKFEIKYQLSLGIPGKYFPKESAEVIKESIFNLIGEK